MDPRLYSCHDDSESAFCKYRYVATYSPLIVFWLSLGFIHGKCTSPGRESYIDPLRGRLRVWLLVLLSAATTACALFPLSSLAWMSAVDIAAGISFAALAGCLEVFRRRQLSVHAGIYLPLLLLTVFRTTLLVTEYLEESWDVLITAQVILLMAETTLLSLTDECKEKKKAYPEQDSSLFGKILFTWISPLVSTGAKRTLEFGDLYAARDDTASAVRMPGWEAAWSAAEKEQRKRNQELNTNEPTSIVRVFASIHLPIIVRITVARFLADLTHYVNPLMLKLLIDFVSTPGGSLSFGIGIACTMFITAEMRSFLLNFQLGGTFRLGVFLQTVLTNTVLKKAMRLSSKARAATTSGEILNLASVDVEKLNSCLMFIQNVWSIPFQITLAMIMLWLTIGPAALAGIFVMIIFIPINYYSSIHIKKWQLKQMKIKDERTKMSNEMLNGLKVIKLYAWEESFEERINRLRNEEVEQLKWMNMANLSVGAANAAAPFLVAMASFTSFVVLNESSALTPAVAFVSLAIFNQIRQPMRILGMMLTHLIQAMVSTKRINNFLFLEELSPNDVGTETAAGAAIVLKDACLNWTGSTEPPLLNNINITIGDRQLTAIVGPVGSGKSSLISSFLGEMHLLGGTVNKNGSIAYVPQQPWIFNKTLRENILFGNKYEKMYYDKVVYACALKRDFAMFPDGDMTEVGENGVNISGGQKARIGLARALYQNCSVYLLDDPLAAVDAHVGMAVYERILGPGGLLADRTRVLVTHGLHYTRTADQIIVMQDGKISQRGDYESLLSEPGLFADLLTQHKHQDGKQPATEIVDPLLLRATSIAGSVASEKSTKQELIKKEQVQEGRVKTGVYWLYMKSMGLTNAAGFFLFFALHYTCLILRSIWLSEWSNQNTEYRRSNVSMGVQARLYVYGGIGTVEILMIMACFAFLVAGSKRSSLSLHGPLLRALLRAPITFFDVTPLGRIMNRLAKDMETVDNLAFSLRHMTQSLLHVFMILLLVTYSIPVFILIAVPLLATYGVIMSYFIPTIRQLKRMESVTRSPILSLIGESIQGAACIRAHNKAVPTSQQMEQYVDKCMECRYLTISTNRWLSTRLELLGNTVVLSASVLGTISAKYYDLSPGLVGLSVSYALSITEVLNIAVRMMGEMETNVVSVERVKEYHRINPEAEWEVEDNTPSDDWPASGAITIQDYQMRYREGLPLVLTGVNVHIGAGQKVAVVGRTGSGKSSLTMGLFRLVEGAGGHIEIDGINTDTIGLHQLRRKMAIIPQDPVLFSGTLRFNLDPFNEYSDTELWSTLEHCQMKSFAAAHAEGLQFQICEGGQNMSIGERQLVCLGRAMLRGGQFVVLDEATAAVDSATDALVQTVVRTHFPHATVIAIAHRLETVADYDRIMVLEKGQVVEFDSPRKLLENPNSQYSQMVRKSNNM